MKKRVGFPLILGASNLSLVERVRPLVFSRGEGVFLWDERGRKYMDAAASFYCAALGFHDSEVTRAAAEQLKKLPFSISAGHRATVPAIELAERLAALAPFPNARVVFANSGSEANDALLKLVRFANIATGNAKRRKLICRQGSYHGCTTLTASLGSSTSLRSAFGLSTEDIMDVAQPDVAQALPGEDEAAFIARLVRQLEDTIESATSDAVAAFIAEPVSFSAGFIVPPKGYFPAIMDVLSKYRIRFVGDEVVTGLHRLGSTMGWQALGLRYQAFTMGKALTAGFAPMGAAIIDEELFEALSAGSEHGMLGHVSTYAAHPVCAAVALRVLDIMEKRNIAAHVAVVAPLLRAALESLTTHPLVGAVRSLGLAGAIVLQWPRVLSESGPMLALASAVQARTLAHGLIVRLNGDVIIVAPPLIISAEEIEDLANRLRIALDEALTLMRDPSRVPIDPTVVHPNRA